MRQEEQRVCKAPGPDLSAEWWNWHANAVGFSEGSALVRRFDMLLYNVNLSVHLLAAFVWLGGLFFLGVVGAPVLRAIEPPTLRQQLFHALGLRFRVVGWACLGILVATGLANLHFRGWLRWNGVLGSAAFWGTPAGAALGIKLAAVVAMLVVSAVHDFVVGPAAGRAEAGTSDAIRLRSTAAWLARLNALLGVLVVLAAIRVVRS
jgi:copper resistance protein D